MRTIFLIICLFSPLAFCLPQEFKVDYFHGQNGVNSLSVVGDDVWAGGFLGLTRINKLNYSIKEVIKDPFIYHRSFCFDVFALADSNGNLFVHDGASLSRYQAGSLKLIDTESSITDVCIDEYNTKWILSGREIIRINTNGTRILYSHANSTLPDYNYTCISVRNNEVFLGSALGFVKFNGTSSQLFNSSNTVLPYSSISSIAVDRHDNIWLSCDTSGYAGRYFFYYAKLAKISGTTGTVYSPFSPTDKGNIKKIVLVEDTVYLCTGYGLMKLDGTAWSAYNKEQNQLLSNNIFNAAFDGNQIWIGTDLGISVMSPDTTINIKLANATFSTDCQGPIIQDLSGNIWIGTGSGAVGNLSRYDGSKWQTIIQASYENPSTFYSLAVDKNNTIWATDYSPQGKLYKITSDTIIIYDQYNSALPSTPIKLAVDKDNNLWITSDWALTKFDGLNWTVYDTNDFAYLTLLHSIAADRKGNIWIAIGQNGMVKFDGNTWTHYDGTFFGNEYSEVNSIIVDVNDDIWIDYSHGTLDPQVCKFDGLTLTWYNKNINLPEKKPYGGLLAVDKKGNLWYSYKGDSNNDGIAKYDWKEWKYYNSNNSRLIGNEIWSFFIDKDEYKWVSAWLYVARFNEDSLYNEINDTTISNKIKYRVFPNPCNEYIWLKSENHINNEVSIKIFDIRGSLIVTYPVISKGEIELNLTNYNSGIYFIQIIGKDFIEMHKILKRK